MKLNNYFINGMENIFNIFGNAYNLKPYWMKDNLTPQEQDNLALGDDWKKIGNDLKMGFSFKKRKATM